MKAKKFQLNQKKLIEIQKDCGERIEIFWIAQLLAPALVMKKKLELVGVGFRAALKDKQLNLQLGFSHDVNLDIPEGIKISVEKQTIVKVSGFDKQQVGMVVSKIKSLRHLDPYKGKGIREKGQYILRKEGKKK